MSTPHTAQQTPIDWLILKTSQTLPDLALILGILCGGWLLAVIMRRMMKKVIERTGLDGVAEKHGVARLMYSVGYKKNFAELCGSIAYIICLLLTFQMCATKLGLSIVSALTTKFFLFMPDAITATLIVVVATKLGEFIRNSMAAKGDSAGADNKTSIWLLFGRAAQGIIIGLGAILAAAQIGIQTEILIQITQTIALVIGIAASIAFGLGAKRTFTQIIASYYARAMIKPGDRIIFETVEGVLQHHGTTTSTLLDSTGKTHSVPASWFMQNTYGIEYVEDQQTASAP